MVAETDNTLPSVYDFSEDVSQAEQPNPLPDGRYKAEIVAVDAKLSKSGNKYADIQVKIEADSYPVDWPEASEYPDGIVLHYRRITLEDSRPARFRLRRFVEKAGLPAVGKSLDLNDWIGREVKADVKAEKGQDGLMYATVADLVAP